MALGLIVDGQSLDIAGAWQHNRSLRRLRNTVATRGDNQPVPGAAGTNAYPVVRHEIVVDLELMVFGINDGSGAPHSGLLAGLDENLETLADWAATHADGSTATWAATLETNSGTVYEAEVQLLNWQIAAEEVTKVVIGYDLRIPAGIWTPAA